MRAETPWNTEKIEEIDPEEMFPAKELPAESNDRFSESESAWLLRTRNQNGLDRATIKIGRKLYIYRPWFRRWIASQLEA